MEILTEVRKGVLIFKVQGELDMHVAKDLQEKMDCMIDNKAAKKIIVNLSGVCFIDSSGLGILLGRYKKVKNLGGSFFLSQAQPSIRRVLEAAGVLPFIGLYETDEEALANI